MSGTSSAAGGPDNSITALLAQLSEGHREVEARLIPQIYEELSRAAGCCMRFEHVNHTLQPTALVNEAYAKLSQEPHLHWKSRTHFFVTASQLMRHILVDHARARCAGKRGGVQHQITLFDYSLPARGQSPIDVLALHEALERLTKFDPRQAHVSGMHFFGGLLFQEIASVSQMGERTMKRDWNMARAWLKGELSKQP